MSGLRGLLLAVRFLLELALLASVAYWGFSIDAGSPFRWIVGIGAPASAAVVWGRWIAPKATRQLEDPPRLILELALFVAASIALIASGQVVMGIWLFVVFVIDRLALTATGGTGGS